MSIVVAEVRFQDFRNAMKLIAKADEPQLMTAMEGLEKHVDQLEKVKDREMDMFRRAVSYFRAYEQTALNNQRVTYEEEIAPWIPILDVQSKNDIYNDTQSEIVASVRGTKRDVDLHDLSIQELERKVRQQGQYLTKLQKRISKIEKRIDVLELSMDMIGFMTGRDLDARAIAEFEYEKYYTIYKREG